VSLPGPLCDTVRYRRPFDLVSDYQVAAGKVMLFTPTPPHLRGTSITQKVPRLATAQTKDVIVRYGRDPFHPAWCSALAA
jgi:hypothetical protein